MRQSFFYLDQVFAACGLDFSVSLKRISLIAKLAAAAIPLQMEFLVATGREDQAHG
jgi:hypothetical protein